MSEPLRYATFNRRAWAQLVDALLLIGPSWGLSLAVQNRRAAALACEVLLMLAAWCYEVLPVWRWGGTPGKLLLRIRVTLVEGEPITLRAALRRAAVGIAFSLVTTVYVLRALLQLSDFEFASDHWLERALRMQVLQSALPGWRAVSILSSAWGWSELITMLFNRRRRALHDYIAGTVVVQR